MKIADRRTILLVEDDYISAVSTKLRLEGIGYAVLGASTGEEAIEAVKGDGGIDLVLMDIDLGSGIDGTEAAAAILRDRDIPIVFLSSHTEPEIVAKTEKITSYGYVVKNSGMTVLDASIKMAFKLFGARREQDRSEAKFRDLFEHMIEGAALHELVYDELGAAVDYRILDVNEAFEKQLGILRAAVVRRTGREAYGVAEAPYLDIYAKVALTGEPATFETYFPAMEKHFTISVYRPSPGHFATIFEDTSERKRTEASLMASEERLRNTIERSGAGYFFIDREGVFRDVNNAWLRLHKFDAADEIIGLHFSATQVDADREKADEIIRNLFAGNEASTGEVTRKRRDGSIGWHTFSINPVSRNGELIGLEGFLIDSTERRNALKALEESEGRLKLALGAAKAGIWEWDLRTNANVWSEEIWQLYGLDPQRASASYESWLATIAPDDRIRVAGEVDRAVRAGTELNIEWRVDGVETKRWLMSRGTPEFDETGKVIRYLGVVIDISERHLNESHLSRLVDLLQHPANDIQGFLDYALEQALQMTDSKFGYIYFYSEERKEFTLNTWSKDVMAECTVANPQTRYELDKTGIWGEAVRQRRPIIVNDFAAGNPLKKGYPEGHVRLYRFLTLPIFKDGKIVATIGLANKERAYDQSDQLQAALLLDAVWKVTERIRAEKEIENLLEEKDLILRETHHRLKNNMNAIAGMLALQMNAAKDETSKRVLKEAESRIHSMLILYSRLYQSASYTSISIKDYLPDLVDEIVQNFATATEVRFENMIEDIRLDAKRMQPLGIIVNELITNIMKYAFVGRREGRISVAARLKDGLVAVSIRDDGVGIPESVDFERPSGFGLTLVRGLVEQLKGSVRIERGAETTVALEFPQKAKT